MRIGALVACVIVLGSVFGMHGAPDRRIDDQATSEYLTAVHAALIEVKKSMPSVGIAVSRVVHSTEHCPAIATDAPHNSSRWSVEVGITETLLIAADRADARVTAKLGKKINRLRWSIPRLTHLARLEVLLANTLDHRKLPGLCAYLQHWARSRFQEIPGGFIQFIHEIQSFSERRSLLSALSTQDRRHQRHEVERLARTVAGELRARILSQRLRILDVVGLRHGASSVMSLAPGGASFGRLPST
jgi:hypothetical protein